MCKQILLEFKHVFIHKAKKAHHIRIFNELEDVREIARYNLTSIETKTFLNFTCRTSTEHARKYLRHGFITVSELGYFLK